MKELIIQTIWNDGAEDFIEINFKVANDKLSANFSGYTSIQDIKNLWGNDLTGRILSGGGTILGTAGVISAID